MVTLIALCAIGAEKVLANEIKFLGYTYAGSALGRVEFLCPADDIFRPNLCLRTADRLYLQLTRFKAENFDSLFEGVYAVPWQDFFKKDVRVRIDKVRSSRSNLSSEHSIQSISHKAVYKKLGEVWRMEALPESGNQSDVRIYIEQNEGLVLLDLSGAPLSRRGYRTEGGGAPIRETLAASLLHLMCWRRKTPLHDPFCGSGTIPIEAALYAYNVAPGFGRHFALENLAIFDGAKAEETRKEEAAKIRTEAFARITGTDIDPMAVKRARANAERAGAIAGQALQLIGSDMRIQRPDFELADFRDLNQPYPEGLLLGNPPYGERLGDSESAETLYEEMSSFFTGFSAWDMGFISANLNFEQKIGRHAKTRKKIKSGNLDTYFYMYKGVSKN